MADVEGSDSPEEDFNPLEDDIDLNNSGDLRQEGQPESLDYNPDEREDVESPFNSIDPFELDKYAITPPTLGRALRRAKEKQAVHGKTRKLSYREYKEQTGRSRHNYSDPGFAPTELTTELTGFEMGSEEQPGTDAKQQRLPVKSKSFKSFKRPRKFERDLKNENLHEVPEGNSSNVLLTPLGQNVLPAIKVDSNRFMSLSQKYQHPQKPSGTRRKLSTPKQECPEDRIEFYNIFSMLINMGDKAKKEKEKNMSRQKSRDESCWVSQVMDYLWLELQAWHSGKSLQDMDRDLVAERQKINSVLQQVINFSFEPVSVAGGTGRADKPMEPVNLFQGAGVSEAVSMAAGDGGIDLSAVRKSPVERCDSREGVMDCDYETTGIFLDRAIIDRQKEAVIKVMYLLNQVDVVEALYPTTKALGKECAMYTCDNFKHNQDTLCLWLNITKDLSHTLNMMAKTLGMQGFEGLDWHLSEYCAHCPISTTSHICDDECCCIQPNEPAEVVRFQVEGSPSEEDSISPEAHPPHYLPQLKLGAKSVRFDSTNPSSPDNDPESMRLTPGTPSSTSTPVKFRSSPSISNMSRTSSEISLDEGAKPWRSVYRHYVEKSLKKMGMRKLLKRLHDLLDGSLQRSKVILEKPNPAFTEISKPSLENDQILSSSPSMNFIPMSPTLHPSPEHSMQGGEFFDKDAPTEGWIGDFDRMGLPSFRPSYLFLARMPLDIVHECLRLRLEQRIGLEGMDPSFLSIRQLIHECKEVLHGAMLVKQYYKQMVSAVMWDSEVVEERLLETDLEQFDDDMKSMMEVYFSYIRKLMSYVQNLPDASRSLKNHLEEEWAFTKKICPHIRGGEAEAGKRFCFMASDLLGSIADFLEVGIDQCTTTLFTRTMSEVDDESLTDSLAPRPIHHSASFSKTHEHRQAIIQTCREFKNLFYEARERASKALGFAKMLKKALEVAADFDINVSTQELLQKLNDTGHTMVIAPHSSDYQMFIPNAILDDKPQIVQLLNTTCGHDAQQLSMAYRQEEHGYLLLVKCDPHERWEGGVIKVEPTAETTIALSHIQVEGLLLVVTHSVFIGHLGQIFKAKMGDCLELVNEQTSCHQAIGESLHELRTAALDLREKVADAIQQVDEKLSMDDLADKEENERISLFKLYTETLHQCYNFGFDYHKEIQRLVTGDIRERLSQGLLGFAGQWMKFVKAKCETGRGTRPRWATQGFDFLTVACDPTVLGLQTEEGFQELKSRIGECVTHIIGSAKQTPVVGCTPTFRVASPDPMSQKFLGRANSVIETSTQQKYNRSQSAKSTSSEPIPSPTPAMHRLSLDNSVCSGASRREGERRASFDYSQAMDRNLDESQEGAAPSVDRDEADAEVEELVNAGAFRMHHIHQSIKYLEEERQSQLTEANMIGKVVSCKTEVDYHINVKRANFTWQRGMKVGDGRFGKVYTAVNLKTGELMAMKVISFQPNDHKTIKDIADEIRTFEGIHHENLVRYFGVELHRDEIMIFMEFCDGGTIEEAAKAGLSEILVRKYTRKLLIAISVLHEHSIVHRDIKGNNIFLTSSGQLKLGDFGCSAKLKNHTTMAGEVNNLVGTTAFMAPEVYTASEDSKGQGRAADIWSLGCVVIEMATGKKPWHDLENDFQIMFKVGSGASPTIPELLSQEGKDFLNLCLVHDPKIRARANVLLDDPFTKVFEEDIK
ncbi:mitogen-activated protein kinase kinase kinase 4-like [Lineus longissimus]|uniref:mitogen-activated protein kinase kinase kinase 4-like n=1 Tax=Lineus longissimus TaxID=88925 RepID=UPI002B4F8945